MSHCNISVFSYFMQSHLIVRNPFSFRMSFDDWQTLMTSITSFLSNHNMTWNHICSQATRPQHLGWSRLGCNGTKARFLYKLLQQYDVPRTRNSNEREWSNMVPIGSYPTFKGAKRSASQIISDKWGNSTGCCFVMLKCQLFFLKKHHLTDFLMKNSLRECFARNCIID